MLKQLVDFIKIKMLTSRMFPVVAALGKNDKDLRINPTLNFNLIGTLTDRNGFISERGVAVEKGKTDMMYRVFWDILMTVNKYKGDVKKEKALLSNLPKEVLFALYDMDIICKEDKAPKVLKYKNQLDDVTVNLDAVQQQGLIVNDSIYIQTGDKVPQAIVEHFKDKFKGGEEMLSSAFDLEGERVWVIDPVTEFVLPVNLSPELLQKLKVAIDGGSVYDCFSVTELTQLMDYRVIVDGAEVSKERDAFQQRIESAKGQLKDQLYTVFKSPFSNSQLNSQKRYFNTVVKSGVMRPSSVQVPNRKYMQNEAYCRFLHFQLNAVVARITEQDTKPSYSFLAHYLPGAILDKHIDRAQCEWNVSMPLYVNEGFDKPWPIFVQTDADDENTIVEVKLELGDMVIYSGNKLYHWREMLEAGKESSVCFFHFVEEGFQGKLD